jgi:hypothetical protein
MKSQQQEKTQTSCKDCLFAIYGGKTQTSCAANRIQLFGDNVIEAFDDDKEFYVINRFCNYYRTKAWNGGQIDFKKLKQETDIPFDLFIDAKNISSSELIQLLFNLKYDQEKIKVSLFHHINENVDISEIRKLIKLTNCSVTACVDINTHLHNSVIRSNNNYHAVLTNDRKSCISNIDTINTLINNDLKQAIIFKLAGVEFISNIAYKLESLINNSISYCDNLTSLEQKSQQENMYIEIGND